MLPAIGSHWSNSGIFRLVTICLLPYDYHQYQHYNHDYGAKALLKYSKCISKLFFLLEKVLLFRVLMEHVPSQITLFHFFENPYLIYKERYILDPLENYHQDLFPES